jgi:peptidoglycan/LPS O-acetylase OafA/YrhL
MKFSDYFIEDKTVANQNNYIEYIDGLRGIAVLMVVIIHFSQELGNGSINGFVIPHFSRLIDSFARGVQLFFIISSFTLFNSIVKSNGENTYKKFYIRRAFRILPLYFLFVFLFYFFGKFSLTQLFTSLTFLFGFFRFENGYEIVPLSWSLFIEETFYILLPLLYYFISKSSNKLRTIFYYFIFSFVLSILWENFAFIYKIPDNNAFIFLFPLNHYFYFFIGIFLFYFLPYIRVHVKPRLLNGLLFIFLPSIIFGHRFALIALTLIFINASVEQTILNNFCKTKLIKSFGKCCYSIYLFHFPLIKLIDPLIIKATDFLNISGGNGNCEFRLLIFTPPFLLITLVIGKFFFNYIELPAVKLSKNIISKYY